MKNSNTTAIRTEIRAKCGKIFFFMVLASIFVKMNLSWVLDADLLDWFAFLPDALCVTLIYYIYLFWHAKKGIVLGAKAETAELKKFPAWRYAKVSLVSSLILTFSTLTLRCVIGAIFIPYDGLMALLIVGVVYAFLLPIFFLIFYLNFLIAYRVAKRHVAVAAKSEDFNQVA